MKKELELWQFIASRLKNAEAVMLLFVAESSGSSPGRAGYKMAIAAYGELIGSIGGGVMEVTLVEQSRAVLSVPPAVAVGLTPALAEQEHRKNAEHPSGMICSGKQTVIFHVLTRESIQVVDATIKELEAHTSAFLTITPNDLRVSAGSSSDRGIIATNFRFEKLSEADFTYVEKLGPKNELYIIGGGHCALALSELMSKMDFRIRLLDDRPGLNTIEKNRYADEITIIESYEMIGELIPNGSNTYVVVMTLGYRSDEVVIRALLDKDLKYFGVLGSRAKMKAMLSSLANEGVSREKLDRIRTPIGLPINSHTPEEIAVSIAAEIIAVKNDQKGDKCRVL